ITQQLAKNLFLTQERTVTRKLQEIVLALWLEHKFSKTQILELYLNRVYFGAGAYGIEGAAQRYFGKSARHLTLAEAAMLAALVAMTPDGVVRALVGGRDYGDSQFDRAVDAKRQPGSAFKPFVYLTALEHGLTPETVREDAPIAVKGWRPENYERQYLGAVTLRQALADSLNTVSVRLTL